MSLRHSKRFDWTIVGDIPQLTSLKGESDEYADLWHDKRAEAIVRSSERGTEAVGGEEVLLWLMPSLRVCGVVRCHLTHIFLNPTK